jgi:hypothetical protein
MQNPHTSFPQLCDRPPNEMELKNRCTGISLPKPGFTEGFCQVSEGGGI